MASVKSLDNIKARLDDFIRDIHSLTTRPPANHKGTLIILYGQTHLGIPQHHIKLREIEAGREAPEFKKCEVLLRGALQDCVLFRTTIHNSSLKNCTVIACTIYGGKIETSQLKDCRIGKKALGIYDTSLPTPFISCCHIENGTVYDAEIFNSTLNGVSPMQNCDIDSSLVIHSFSLDSTLSSCGVHESKLHSSKAVAGVLTESVVESKYFLTLRTFPVEIRRAIYSNVIANDGLTTSLIAALRPDSLLYGEILEILFQEHAFLLSGENQEVFKSASKKILQRITKIDLKAIKPIPTSEVSMYFPIRTKITSIKMEFQDRRVNIQHFYNVTKLWFKYFGTVSKFTVVWKDSKPWKQGDFQLAPDPPEALKGAIKVANKWLKIEAILVKGKSQERKEVNSKGFVPGILRRPDVILGPELETFTWTWSVKRDSALVWNFS